MLIGLTATITNMAMSIITNHLWFNDVRNVAHGDKPLIAVFGLGLALMAAGGLLRYLCRHRTTRWA
jgi:hypothetical protein